MACAKSQADQAGQSWWEWGEVRGGERGPLGVNLKVLGGLGQESVFLRGQWEPWWGEFQAGADHLGPLKVPSGYCGDGQESGRT